MDTLIGSHCECTCGLDIEIKKGKITIPDEIKNLMTKDYMREMRIPINTQDIRVCGNFPIDLLDPTAFFNKAGEMYKVVGKVIKADTANSCGVTALFYVEDWKTVNAKE